MLKTTMISILNSTKNIGIETSIRNMSKVKTRFTMPPFWQPKKTRVLYPENITQENQEFIKEHIKNKYNSPLKEEVFERGTWSPNSYRCGLITKKIGVHPVWRKDGKRGLATLLHVSDNHIVRYIPPEELKENDYMYDSRVQRKSRSLAALVVGTDSADPRQFTKEYFNVFHKAGVMPKKKLAKFYITPNAYLPPGMPLVASHFQPGDFVDCAGLTIDRGFQGVMKRWGFKGLKATHGVTKSHRRGGNIGGGTGAKARVWPGTKMPGHMGRQKRILKGARILRVNTKHNVIWVEGTAIPGETGNYVTLYDSIFIKHVRGEEKQNFFPTFFPEGSLKGNLYQDTVHDLRLPSIIFAQDKKK